MDNFEDIFEKLTDYDLLAVIKAGPDDFYSLVEAEALRRMRKKQLEGQPEKENQSPTEAPAPAIKKRRPMSEAAKKRISAAQKKRWKEWKRNNP